jgi:CheY-like chemotaxis protein
MTWGVELNQDELDIESISRNVAAEGEFFSGIMEVVFSVAKADSIAEVSSPEVTGAKGDRKSVMLVDDNEATLNLLQVILRTEFREEELEFIPCSSGMQAFSQALENKPDLILLDLMMPEKGGFEVLEELKNNPDTLDIPVVILSVIYDEESVSKAERFGVDRYLVKPFVPFDITRVIREIVFEESLEV